MDTYIPLDISVLLIFVAVFLATYLYVRPRVNLPPGPTSFPVLGSVGFLRTLSKRLPHKAFDEEARKHGGIISIWVGPKLFVILNGYGTIRKSFVDQSLDFIDRPNWLPIVKPGLQNGTGLTWSNGQEWKAMRKFSLKALRTFGVGKRRSEVSILAEVRELCTVLKGQMDSPFSIHFLLKYAASNIICSVVFGQRFEYDDKIFHELLERLDAIISGAGFISVTNFLPEFMFPLFPKEYKIYMDRKQSRARFHEIIDDIIEDHQKSFDKTNIRDFIDLYLETVSEEEESSDSYLKRGNMYRVIFDLFLAGSETTATALDWACLYMIEYPDVQTKCRQLITQNVGQRAVTLSDRDSLSYVVAVIQEVLRLSNVVPLGLPRTCADHDVVIDGFTIPKRTMIMPNLYSAHVDPKCWNAPEEFKPERFLNENGRLVNTEALMPLSIGPRMCAGEKLAKEELFLFFSNLIQQFEFKRADESVGHDFSPKPKQFVSMVPNAYKLRVCSPAI